MKTPKKPVAGHATSDEAAAFIVEEVIRRRAYELYEQRGRGDGHALEDWLTAEAELRPESGSAAA